MKKTDKINESAVDDWFKVASMQIDVGYPYFIATYFLVGGAMQLFLLSGEQLGTIHMLAALSAALLAQTFATAKLTTRLLQEARNS